MTDHVLPTTLSKSRFKLALQCPRKLAYASDRRYLNAHDADELLEALADGGHQVGALARLMFPGGVEVTDRTTEAQLEATAALAARANVVIYEATFLAGGLLARVDVLVKQGDDIQLIEVKSKGFNPDEDSFRGKRGGIASGWGEYLYDVAFQQLVLQRAQPGWQVRPFLMLIDTRVAATVEGLGARFRVERDAADHRRVTVHAEPGFDVAQQAPPLLLLHDVTDEIATLRAESVPTTAGEQPLEAFVDSLAGELAAGRAPAVAYGRQCRSCEFYAEPGTLADNQRSGWHECMAIARGGPVDVPRSHTVFGLSNCRYLDRLLLRGRFALAQVEDTDLDTNASPDEITPAHRHRLQVSEAHHGVERFLLEPQIRAAFAELSWPLHFIDFETARSALPFHQGHQPNQQLLFQFSHHTLAADGSLRHARQSLVAEPGIAPSLLVLRDLRDSLAETPGSVVHWFDHERSVLKDLAHQLAASDAPDRDSLLGFIASLAGTGGLPGRLFDLGRLVQRAAFFAGTAGSSSIKQVLPAVMRQSALLRSRCAQPLYGTAAMPSLNYAAGKAWWLERCGGVADPYSLLGPMFTDAEMERAIEQGEQEEGGAFVANGGAAMVAYGQLQQRDLPESERPMLREQLLRYCELDTLAMVMVYEALADWVR